MIRLRTKTGELASTV